MRGKRVKEVREITRPNTISYAEIAARQHDPDIAKGLVELKAEILSQPYAVVASDETLSIFVRQCLSRVWTPLLMTALEAFEWGHSPMEVEWDLTNMRILGRELPAVITPVSVTPAPPRYTKYLLDGETKQVCGWRLSVPSIDTHMDCTNEKAMWYSHLEQKAGSPYGVSLLLRCSESFQMFDDLTDMLGSYIEHTVLPSLMGFAPSGVIRTPSGEIEATEYLRELLMQYRNEGVVVLPMSFDEHGNREWGIEAPVRVSDGSSEIVNLIQVIQNRLKTATYSQAYMPGVPASGTASLSLAARYAFFEILWAINRRLVKWIVQLNWGNEEWAFVEPANLGADIDLVRDIVRTILQFAPAEREKVIGSLDMYKLLWGFGLPLNLMSKPPEAPRPTAGVPGMMPGGMSMPSLPMSMPGGGAPPMELPELPEAPEAPEAPPTEGEAPSEPSE